MSKIPFMATLLFMGLWFLHTLPAFGAIHDQLATTPYGWTRVATPDDNSIIISQIGLQEQNLDQLEPLLYAVSTPGSTRYGDSMEANDVRSLLQPSSEANSAVLAWL